LENLPKRLPVGHIPSSKSTIVYRLSAFDLGAAVAAPVLALWIRNPIASFSVTPTVIATYTTISVCFSVLFFVWFKIARSLPDHFSIHDAGEIAKASLCAVMSTAAFAFTITRLDQIPRSVPAIHFLTLIAILLSVRLFHGKMVKHRELRAAGAIAHDSEKNVIIVGAGTLASLYVGFLESIPHGGWRIAAILDDSKWLHGRSILGHTIVGGTEEAEALLDDFAQHGLKMTTVIVCDQDRGRALDYRDRLAPLCLSSGLQLEVLIEKLGVFEDERPVRGSPTSPVLLANAGYFRAKRAFELLIAALGLAMFLPVLVLTSLLVLASAGSPVIFWQRRVGRNARPIFVYKFKTMRNAVDRKGRLLSAQERRTRVGQILRATRLDELPQLLNVIKGDMAIIGPRPLLPVDQPAEPSLRLAVAPGLTGWAQINGGKLVSIEEKNSLDEWYVRNASLRLDAEIVWRTFLTVLFGDRRNEDQLAAALAHARRDQKRPTLAIVAEARQDLSAFAEQNRQRAGR
jgi:lipopolysaccharide/colanic/teichoic acid biosynthesis glycosyltransferase